MSYYVREPRGVDVDAAAMQAAGGELARAAADGGGRVGRGASSRGSGSPPGVAEAVLARVEISCAQGASGSTRACSSTSRPSRRCPATGSRAATRASRWRWPRRSARACGSDAAVAAVEDGGRADGGRRRRGGPRDRHRARAASCARCRVALPAWKREALERVELGHAAKLHVAARGRRAPERRDERARPLLVLDGDGRRRRRWRRCSTASRARPGRSSGSAWPVVAGALARRASPRCGRSSGSSRERAVLTTWDDDPWAGFAYRADGLRAAPGDDDALAAPVGALHFAGEHTAGAWSALMEGALRSGARAAAEVAAALGR